MEINITHMIKDSDTMPMLSGSRMELGDNAGAITWNNSKEYAKEKPLVSSPEEIQETKKYFAEFGAWSKEEIAAWDIGEVNALLIQYIAGDIREMEMFETFKEYEESARKGTVSGNIFKADDGQFYFYVGS